MHKNNDLKETPPGYIDNNDLEQKLVVDENYEAFKKN